MLAVALPAAGDNSFNLSRVAPGVFVHTGRQVAPDAPDHDDIANLGFVVGRRCVAVIDTGGSVRIGRQLHTALRRRTKLPICYVINTHVHYDHVLGNFAFKADHPQFVGSAALAPEIARNRGYFLQHFGDELQAPPTPDQIIGPTRLVAVGHTLQLDLGDRRLTLRAWPPAHTDSDLTVLDPRSGTLWTGDLLFRGRLPELDGSAAGWLKAIGHLAGMKVAHVVPGHGPPTDDLAAALVPEQRYLQALIDGVRAELAQGQSLQHAIDHVADAQRDHWLLWQETNPHNVARVYQALEWQ